MCMSQTTQATVCNSPIIRAFKKGNIGTRGKQATRTDSEKSGEQSCWRYHEQSPFGYEEEEPYREMGNEAETSGRRRSNLGPQCLITLPAHEAASRFFFAAGFFALSFLQTQQLLNNLSLIVEMFAAME
ncbi:kinesin family protein [Aspergillus luchuensis]|uniref:Kinesin family protein n=1 Tax=Aspergillus kawachii TaxID=1069201 RepID=A0A146FBA5_ASPKA|nr:kinesin family protein [Aspergillus luchuensis]